MNNTKYLRFVDETTHGRKTKVISIYSVRSDAPLGMIAWYGSWRQYAFYPCDGTIWNPECLDSVNLVIRELMVARSLDRRDE